MAPKHFMTNLMDRPDLPLVATAIHSGHALDDKIEKTSELSDAERLPEEDPFTDLWTAVTGNRIIVHHSRFEVDLNRPREKAVYLEPEDAWGLNVWKTKPSPVLHTKSLEKYDVFYEEVRRGLTDLERQNNRKLQRGLPPRHPRFHFFSPSDQRRVLGNSNTIQGNSDRRDFESNGGGVLCLKTGLHIR